LQEKRLDIESWLPITPKEAKKRGWETVDVVLFTGDAYIDHPAFGSAVIGRILEKLKLKVAIVPQPNWQDDLRDFRKFGKPNLFFGVTAGAMDSMVNHYTANRRLRSNDAYTAGNKSGFRPDYTVKTYSNILKELYPDIPVVIGGVEASLRRLTHFDYWADKLLPSILVQSKANLLIYGMGEKPLKELVRLLLKGVPFDSIKNINQTAFIENREFVDNIKEEKIEIASHEKCLQSKFDYAKNFKIIEQESNKYHANTLVQKSGDDYVVVLPPYPPMTTDEIDESFDLNYTRLPHPKYKKKGNIPAFEMIKFSVNMHRGCFGGCSFCTISAHQGKFVSSRSEESILKEVDAISNQPDFKGYLSDLGGPSANMYRMQGKDLSICESCLRPSCIFPKICRNLDTDHSSLIEIYKKVDENPKIKAAFIGSGIRYDMLVADELGEDEKAVADKYIEQLAKKHVSGRLKIAPEHTSDDVLKIMRKPSFKYFYNFEEKFLKYSKKAGKNQFIIPYFISSHPGSQTKDMLDLALKTKKLGFKLEQVQDFTPTPMTVATVIYYSGIHPYTLKKVFVAKTKEEKLNQRVFFFWYQKSNHKEIKQILKKENLSDKEAELLRK
jgi:uncharacterized radical SAM protein YgiQ